MARSDNNNAVQSNNYWHENIRILRVLLGIWFVVSFLLSIVFVDQLDAFKIGGFKLGFWMAQQGSIYIFVILIFVYIYLMDKLDLKYQVDQKHLDTQAASGNEVSASAHDSQPEKGEQS